MIAKEIICENFPVLKKEDDCEKAIDLMTEFNVGELPVVENGQLIGLLREDQALELFDVSIDKIPALYNDVSVLGEVHIFEVIKAFVNHKITIMPVVDAHGNYLGAISIKELFEAFAQISSLDEPGGILILEIKNRDYSMVEISRIVENNQGKIICSYVNMVPEQQLMEVTLKINRQNLGDIISAFERFDYTVKSTHQESSFNEELKDRFDGLMKYLSI